VKSFFSNKLTIKKSALVISDSSTLSNTEEKLLRLQITQVAHGIGMQAQYLSYAVRETKVVGAIAPNGDYHSRNSWVEVQSVKHYIQWQYANYMIGKEQYDSDISFLDKLLLTHLH
jgi:hypothetical protein